MAPEVLQSRDYTLKSDVWSFGVVLYEIFSLGESPYPGFPWSQEFLDMLYGGYRMPSPEFANHEM